MNRWPKIRRLPSILGVTAMASAFPLATGHAQDEAARNAWREGQRLAIEGQPDSAAAELTRAASLARAAGDRAMATAVRRSEADLLFVYRGCVDSAERVLVDAVATAAPGDRSAADALVRLLAARGDLPRARTVLVAAYGDVPSVGRLIIRESITFLQGMAAIERFAGHEASAMSTLNSALQVAVRLHEGDLADSSTHALGAVTSENAWVMFDIAQLRMHASSAGIAAPREGVRLLEQLVDAWSTVSDPVAARFPVSRLADRLELKAVACARNGKPCPPPKPPKSPKC